MHLASEIKTRFPDLTIHPNVPLSNWTTFRLGGPCPCLIDQPPEHRLPELIRTLHELNCPVFVMGQGSNLLVSDAGLDAVVIRFCTQTPHLESAGNRVCVSGATLLEDFARIAVEQALGDLAYCTGIPGTVGGGIAGNAGAFGRQLGDHLVEATLVGLDGAVRTVSRADLQFSYRHSLLKETGEILLRATFELPRESTSVLRAERERILEFRRRHHPDWTQTPCAGSFFKNIEPTSAVERRKAAGHFLEQAHAKQMRVGGASVFEKHANIIVGGADCSAQDVCDLSRALRAAVRQQAGIELVPEVRLLGNFN